MKGTEHNEEIRIGVYICHCGLNIAGSVDCEGVAQYASKLPDVVISKDIAYLCSEPGQTEIKQDIVEQGINRVVVGACTPRLHEPTFRQCIEGAGLNPYLMEIANLREQCSWVHGNDRDKATVKAMDLVRSAVARVRLLTPLRDAEVSVEKTSLIIGGGVAGIQAALDLADAGFRVVLVEKEPTIGGIMARLDKTFPTMDCSI
jgi:heterodisulfide reductase subunit A